MYIFSEWPHAYVRTYPHLIKVGYPYRGKYLRRLDTAGYTRGGTATQGNNTALSWYTP